MIGPSHPRSSTRGGEGDAACHEGRADQQSQQYAQGGQQTEAQAGQQNETSVEDKDDTQSETSNT